MSGKLIIIRRENQICNSFVNLKKSRTKKNKRTNSKLSGGTTNNTKQTVLTFI